MEKFSLLRDFDQMQLYEGGEYFSNEEGNLLDSSILHSDFSLSKSQNPTIQQLLAIIPLSQYELSIRISKEELIRKENERLRLSYKQLYPQIEHEYRQIDKQIDRQIDNNNHIDQYYTHSSKLDQWCLKKHECISDESSLIIKRHESEEQDLGKQVLSQKRGKDERTKKIKRYEKNQYDKNIPGNIVLTVVNYILRPIYKQEIQFYCQQLKTQIQAFDITYSEVVEFAKNIKGRTSKFGTSQLGNFFCDKKRGNSMQKVFGLFLIRFLREQYYLHILKVGKMSNKSKYLEFATKMMYIPRLTPEEYSLMHQFRRKDA